MHPLPDSCIVSGIVFLIIFIPHAQFTKEEIHSEYAKKENDDIEVREVI